MVEWGVSELLSVLSTSPHLCPRAHTVSSKLTPQATARQLMDLLRVTLTMDLLRVTLTQRLWSWFILVCILGGYCRKDHLGTHH